METKWLEDFVSLAQTRSFSRSAQLRHVTQPAFSRRIQALEAWAGTDLVDRSSYPTRLTPAGKTLLDQAVDMLQALQATRAMLRTHHASAQDVIEFAVPHTLAFTFFPSWVSMLGQSFRSFNSRLIALNVHDAVMRMTEGSCDLLMIYHHPSQPVALSAERYDMLVLGTEALYAVSKPKPDGTAMYALPGNAKKPLPYLGYSAGAYLGRAVDHLLKQSVEVAHLERVYETDMAEGLRAMALEGHGIAFLPDSAVRTDMAAGRLVSAGQTPSLSMEIRLYRQKPGVDAVSEAAVGNDSDKGLARSLWRHLHTSLTPSA
jgi:LysR family transcriptional regulator, hypochlorite-specific transcription factor HypT